MRFGVRELVFLVVLLAVPVVSMFYVFQPRNEEISQALDEIEVKQARLNTLAEVNARIDDVGRAIEEGRQLIQIMEAKLPTEQSVDGILEQVWQITATNGLTVKSVKAEPPIPAALYKELPLKMVVVGDFDGFYEFLLQLENLERITRIHEMKIERRVAKGSNDDGSGGMEANFTLSIYFEPSTGQAGTGEESS